MFPASFPGISRRFVPRPGNLVQFNFMPKLGFLGLGLMGYPMARNLLRAGHEVAVWSNTSAKAQKLADTDKGKFCATPKGVAENADVLFLCVGDTAMAKDVILGPNGIVEGVRSGSVVVDWSTIAVSQSRAIGQALKAKGVDFLDAPVTGSTPGAEGGNLTFMIGGDRAVFDRIRPLLDPIGKKIYFCGAAGMGLQAKLTQNLVLSNILMAFNEGMVLATKGGMDPALMLESGQELGVPLLLTGLTRQLFQTAISAGHGDEDICSTIKVLEEFAGVEVNSQK